MEMNRNMSIPVRAALIAILLVSFYGCRQSQTTVTEPHIAESKRLLREADSLMKADTAFYFSVTDRKTERSAAADSLIRAKLDSAVSVAPHYGKAYIGKVIYLGQCYKFRESLAVLRLMDTNTESPMNADMRGMKAILEDIIGDSIIARYDFALADRAYAELEDKYRGDPRFIGYRFNRMLNLSLMDNDFSILKEDMERSEYSSSVEGIEIYKSFESKDEFYRYLLPVLFNGEK